jgi:hypothetical protein
MRGAAFLRQSPTALAVSPEELEAAMALRSTRNPEELLTVWSRDVDHMTGAPRERLRLVYAEMLGSFGALAG